MPVSLGGICRGYRPGKSLAAAKNYEVIKNARCFAIGGTGAAGVISGEEMAFRDLLRGPDPAVHCQKLLTEATPEGRLYALLGLRLLDKQMFQAAIGEMKASKTEVRHIAGCMVMQVPTAILVTQIEKGDYR